MSDDEFLDFIEFLNFCIEVPKDFEDEIQAGDDGWEYEAEKFYSYNPDDIENDDSLPY